MDLTELLRRPEGKTLELKRDLSSPSGVLRTLVAFANTAGGALLIGDEDGTRPGAGSRRSVRQVHAARRERLPAFVLLRGEAGDVPRGVDPLI